MWIYSSLVNLLLIFNIFLLFILIIMKDLQLNIMTISLGCFFYQYKQKEIKNSKKQSSYCTIEEVGFFN